MQSQLEVSSVSLVKIDAANLPQGFASGCLMDYYGHRLLLTVAHAAQNGPPLALSLGWDPAMRRMKLYPLSGLNFLSRAQFEKEMNLNEIKLTDVDFAYLDLPSELEPRLETIDALTGNIIESRPCTIWPADAIAEPRPRLRYGFAGHTMPGLEDHALIATDVKFCFTELRVCFPLSFVSQHDDLFAFRLPVEHPGDAYFKGCSGAPIIGEEGHVVALVCGGSVQNSMVYGISLRRYQFALDIQIGRFN